jgi:hypothetical protein
LCSSKLRARYDHNLEILVDKHTFQNVIYHIFIVRICVATFVIVDESGINMIYFPEDKRDSAVCNCKRLNKIGNISKYQAMNVPYMHWDTVYISRPHHCPWWLHRPGAIYLKEEEKNEFFNRLCIILLLLLFECWYIYVNCAANTCLLAQKFRSMLKNSKM